MISTTIKAALALSVLSFAEGALLGQTVPAHEFVVLNNSAVPLACRAHWAGTWHEIFHLGAGSAWDPPVAAGGKVWIFCDAPAASKVYAIEPGQRYSWLRNNPQSPVTLRRIVT